MNISQTARDAAERYHRFALDYPELADRALPEFIQVAMDHAKERAREGGREAPCTHEWYQGMCVHCETTVKEFRDPARYVQ